jgi:hypothetical protein
MSLSGVVPPPLTPPHKGEGDYFIAFVSNNDDDWSWAALQPDSPPPCGEGLGVGVARHRHTRISYLARCEASS